MKYGVREIANCVFRAHQPMKLGKYNIVKGQPVLYIDSAKTSTIEGAATTVYATGGRGNANLISWEGEKTLTFTVEDALLSPVSMAILSGAGLFKKPHGDNNKIHVHMTSLVTVGTDYTIDLGTLLGNEVISYSAPYFILLTEDDGSLTGDMIPENAIENFEGHKITLKNGKKTSGGVPVSELAGKTVMVDYYTVKDEGQVSELVIDAENFAGYYYVEAETLFRKQIDGVDAPVNITLPLVKVQSNFTFSMASSGDPSTFTFTMDAMPGYTYFDKTKKVLCVMQIIEDSDSKVNEGHSVMSGEYINTSLTGTGNMTLTDITGAESLSGITGIYTNFNTANSSGIAIPNPAVAKAKPSTVLDDSLTFWGSTGTADFELKTEE